MNTQKVGLIIIGATPEQSFIGSIMKQVGQIPKDTSIAIAAKVDITVDLDSGFMDDIRRDVKNAGGSMVAIFVSGIKAVGQWVDPEVVNVTDGESTIPLANVLTEYGYVP